MDLNNAAAAHAQWKTKLRAAIAKQETLDAMSIGRDDCCDFGKWLHSEGKTKFGRLASFDECKQQHAAFHKEAGSVARAINQKKYKEAEAMLAAGTTYSAVSTKVGVAILRLKKEANL